MADQGGTNQDNNPMTTQKGTGSSLVNGAQLLTDENSNSGVPKSSGVTVENGKPTGAVPSEGSPSEHTKTPEKVGLGEETRATDQSQPQNLAAPAEQLPGRIMFNFD